MAVWLETLGSLAAGAVVGWAGYALGALMPGAALALALISGLCGFAGGWPWSAVLLVAVLSNSLWHRYGRSRQPSRQSERTNWVALAATLLWPLLLALLARLTGQAERLHIAYAGAVAVVAADAWATELGLLSLQAPRTFISRRRVAAGTPGAMSLLGNVAALTGAWLVGLATLAARVLQRALGSPGTADRYQLWMPLCAALGGVAGCLVDSFLGATAQALYYCEQCGAYSESLVHTCGHRAAPVRGWSWLTDEAVNLVSTVVGAAISATLYWGLARTGMAW